MPSLPVNILVLFLVLSLLPLSSQAGEKNLASSLALTAEQAHRLNRIASEGADEFDTHKKKSEHEYHITAEQWQQQQMTKAEKEAATLSASGAKSDAHEYRSRGQAPEFHPGKNNPNVGPKGPSFSLDKKLATNQSSEGSKKTAKLKPQKPPKEKLPGEEKYARHSDRTEDWLFHTLPRHIGQDIKYSFWNRWQALMIGAGAGLAVGIHAKDDEIIRSVRKERFLNSKFDKAMEWGAHPLVLGGATLLAFGASKLAHDEKAAMVTGTMLEAFAITEVATIGLQFATRRRTPDGASIRSFPSAHTSGAFALASVATVYYGPAAGVPSYALATMIGLSRVDSLKHAASDVIGSAVLGTVIGVGTAKFHKNEEFKDYFIIPTASHNSAGISLYHPF